MKYVLYCVEVEFLLFPFFSLRVVVYAWQSLLILLISLRHGTWEFATVLGERLFLFISFSI